MVAAGVGLGVAERFAPDDRPAMGAAVDEGVQHAVAITVHDNGRVPDRGGQEVTRVRQLRLKRQVRPGWTSKDAVLLLLVKFRIAVGGIGNARHIGGRPSRFSVAFHMGTSCVGALRLRAASDLRQ